jgi:WD40 repeat protein
MIVGHMRVTCVRIIVPALFALLGDARIAAQGAAAAPISGAPMVLGTPIRMHDGGVAAAGFSRDGALALSAGMRGEITLHDLKTGRKVLTFTTSPLLSGAAFCGGKSERVAAVHKEPGLEVFDARTGKKLGQVAGLDGLAVSPDGMTLATFTAAGEVQLVDAMTLAKKPPVPMGKEQFVAPAFSSDGRMLIADEFMQGRTHVVDLVQGKDVGVVETRRMAPTRAIAPDGKSMLAIVGAALDRFRLPDGERTPAVKLPFVATAVAMVNGAEVVVGDLDGAIAHVEIASGKVLHRWHEHRSCVNRLVVAPDGVTLLSGSLDHTVRFWNLADGRQLVLSKDHNDIVWAVAISPDGKRIASGSADNSAILWGADGKAMARSTAHQYAVTAVAVQGDGTWWSASQDRTLRHYDDKGAELGKVEFENKRGWVTAMALMTPNGPLITGHNDGRVTCQPCVAGQPAWQVEGGKKSITAVAADAGHVATADDSGTVIVWNPTNQEKQAEFQAHADGVASMLFTGGGNLLTCGDKGELKRWEAASGTAAGTVVVAGKSPEVQSLALLAPRGLVVAVTGIGLQFFTADTLKPAGTFAKLPTSATVVAASDDGSLLAIGGADGTVACWRVDGAPPATPTKPKK